MEFVSLTESAKALGWPAVLVLALFSFMIKLYSDSVKANECSKKESEKRLKVVEDSYKAQNELNKAQFERMNENVQEQFARTTESMKLITDTIVNLNKSLQENTMTTLSVKMQLENLQKKR